MDERMYLEEKQEWKKGGHEWRRNRIRVEGKATSMKKRKSELKWITPKIWLSEANKSKKEHELIKRKECMREAFMNKLSMSEF